MRIRDWKIPFVFLVALCAAECSWGASVCESPLLAHSDPAEEREFQNVYGCFSNGTFSTLTASSGTIKSFMVVGTATNDNAPTGRIGEYFYSNVTAGSPVTYTTSGNYQDLTSISLTAGDWDVTGVVSIHNNSSGSSAIRGAISTTAGNSTTGLVMGDTNIESSFPTSTNDATVVIPAVRFSLASSATVYLKMYVVFSVPSPQGYGRISARRVR